jgi:hypothetical protein
MELMSRVHLNICNLIWTFVVYYVAKKSNSMKFEKEEKKTLVLITSLLPELKTLICPPETHAYLENTLISSDYCTISKG